METAMKGRVSSVVGPNVRFIEQHDSILTPSVGLCHSCRNAEKGHGVREGQKESYRGARFPHRFP